MLCKDVLSPPLFGVAARKAQKEERSSMTQESAEQVARQHMMQEHLEDKKATERHLPCNGG
eukprot:5438629-Amphidinium_carterae.1